MTKEEAREIVAKLREGCAYISGPRETPNQPHKWELDGKFSAKDLEALAIVFHEQRP